MFVIGGSAEQGKSHSEILASEIEDGDILSWDIANSFPRRLIWHSVATKLDYTYVIGGYLDNIDGITQHLDDVFLGTIVNNNFTWEEQVGLPEPLSLGAAAIVGNKLYYTGGFGPSGINQNVYAAEINEDGTLNNWQDVGDLPLSVRGHVMFATGEDTFVILAGQAGMGPGDYSDDVFRGKINSDGTISWSNLPNLPVGMERPQAEKVGNLIVVTGGRNSVFLDSVYYSFITNSGGLGTWQESDVRLPEAMCCGSLTELNGYLYLIGGHTPGYLDTVYSAEVSIPDPPQLGINPLVFLPGGGASWNSDAILHGSTVPDTEWEIAPYAKYAYTDFLDEVKRIGYTEDETLYVYPYDWRRPVARTAELLGEFINTAIIPDLPIGTKVDVVGHSMGGLVARTWAQGHPDLVNKLVTAGSPHLGFVRNYYLWEGADFRGQSALTRLGLQILLAVTADKYETSVEVVQRTAPGMRDLLPVFDYLKDMAGSVLPEEGMVWRNEFLPELAGGLESIKSMTGTLSGGGYDTARFIAVKDRKSTDAARKIWADGKPAGLEYGSGDGTVLDFSAALDDTDNHTVTGIKHDGLFASSAGQTEIFRLLELEAEPVDAINPDYGKSVAVTVASPVTFGVVDTDGATHIPEDNLVVIPGADTGQYQVEVVATGPGAYTLYFGRLSESDAAWSIVKGIFNNSGESRTYSFDADFERNDLGLDQMAMADQKLEELTAVVMSSLLPLGKRQVIINELSWLQANMEKLGSAINQGQYEEILLRTDRDIGLFISQLNGADWKRVAPEVTRELASELRRIKAALWEDFEDKYEE